MQNKRACKKNQLDLAAQLDRARERTHTAELVAAAATAERDSLASDATQAAARERAHVEQIANLQDELAKSNAELRSLAGMLAGPAESSPTTPELGPRKNGGTQPGQRKSKAKREPPATDGEDKS